jgi:hypothetical protein
MSFIAPAPLFDSEWRRAAGSWPVDLGSDSTLRKSFDVLRNKWGEVPAGELERAHSAELLKLNDDGILEKWTIGYLDSSTGSAFTARGWYQTIYRDVFRGKKVLDVGCGLAPDNVHYAEHGAVVTFLDIVESNVQFVERVCAIKGIHNATFCFMRDLDSLAQLPKDYDFLYCCGSFITAPLEVARMEAQALLRHLPVGGRWIELGYPRQRWERDGCPPETEWGAMTDGGAPWMEYHDLAKLNYILAPAQFEPVLHLNFHGVDFNWFDLIRRA